MKKVKIRGLIFTLLIVTAACKNLKNEKESNLEKTHPKAELAESFESLSESADTEITAVSLNGNILTLNVRFSGGCEQHDFKLYGSSALMKSLPPQRSVTLWHNNHGDSCRELVEQELKFDITALAYEGGEVQLNLVNWGEPILYRLNN